jgi:hypothetical protein
MVWKTLLGLRRTVIEKVEFEDTDESLVVSVRPRAKERDRCRTAGGAAQGMTKVRVDGGGARSISPRRSAT